MNVGDKVWYTQPRTSDIGEGIVTKIGRQYFYVSRCENDGDPFKVNKETMRDHTNYGYGYHCQVYLSKQEILDERERNALWLSLSKFFGGYYKGEKLSLETLREIAKLTGIEVDVE